MKQTDVENYQSSKSRQPPTGGMNKEILDQVFEAVKHSFATLEKPVAIWILERLCQAGYTNPQAHHQLGMWCYEASRIDEAQAHLQQATDLAPDSAVYAKDLGDFFYVARGDITKTLECYEKAAFGMPTNHELLLTIGHLYVSRHNLEKALVYYRKVHNLNPSDTEVKTYIEKITARCRSQAPSMNVDELSEHVGNKDAAALMTQVEQGPQSVPTAAAHPDIPQLYASVSQKVEQGDIQSAITELQRILALHPGHASVLNDLGVLHYELGNKQEALNYYERSVQAEPDNAVYLKNMADFYYVEQGRTEEALRIYVALLEKDPEDVDCLAAAGTICAVLGRNEDARLFFERVLEVEPWHQLAMQVLGRLDQVDGMRGPGAEMNFKKRAAL
jgi:tetratricopeptide (TPR) repeat protein